MLKFSNIESDICIAQISTIKNQSYTFWITGKTNVNYTTIRVQVEWAINLSIIESDPKDIFTGDTIQ